MTSPMDWCIEEAADDLYQWLRERTAFPKPDGTCLLAHADVEREARDRIDAFLRTAAGSHPNSMSEGLSLLLEALGIGEQEWRTMPTTTFKPGSPPIVSIDPFFDRSDSFAKSCAGLRALAGMANNKQDLEELISEESLGPRNGTWQHTALELASKLREMGSKRLSYQDLQSGNGPINDDLQTIDALQLRLQRQIPRLSCVDVLLGETTSLPGYINSGKSLFTPDDIGAAWEDLVRGAWPATNQTSRKSEGVSDWKPPDGYVGSSEILRNSRFQKRGKNPARSTIAQWEDQAVNSGMQRRKVCAPLSEADMRAARESSQGEGLFIVQAPGSGENYYPEKWVLDRLENWNPRRQKV